MKNTQTITVDEIREQLKKFAMQELQKLPATLKELEPKERLNILCKLMPFIMPKLESLHPSDFKWLED